MSQSDIDAYYKLREKLIAISQGTYRVKPLSPNLHTRVHHYIPVHFIKGFLNNESLLWRYDKVNDRIIKDQKGPKSVFFRPDRNSVVLGEKRFSIFEHYYSIIDNLTPFALNLLRGTEELSNNLFFELYHQLNVFIVDLYWRNINSDFAFDDLYNSSPIYVRDSASPLSAEEINHLKSRPEVKQHVRFNMSLETIRVIEEYLLNNNVMHGMIDFDSNQLCLGDMPYLIQKRPSEHLDFIRQPLLLPISSRKLYARNIIKPNMKWDASERALLNALIIDQSTEMIVCAERSILELAINTYHLVKNSPILPIFRARLFSQHNR